MVADKAEDYAAAHVKVMHFIAYRKLGMQVVYDAFMEKGLEGAYEAWAGLPHSEAGYENNPRLRPSRLRAPMRNLGTLPKGEKTWAGQPHSEAGYENNPRFGSSRLRASCYNS